MADEPVAAGAPGTAAQVTAGGPVAIPVADVSDGTVHYFETDVDGTTVKYFAVKASDGTIRTSLDACRVCFQAKKGYTQDGADVICGNCGRSFAIDQIGVQHGGCNPIAIDSTTQGDQLHHRPRRNRRRRAVLPVKPVIDVLKPEARQR